MALGADDPLLFRSRLVDQYVIARDVHGFSDEELADLARASVRASRAADDVRARLLAGDRRVAGRLTPAVVRSIVSMH